jgi:tetratricopeptide (TPR) repeat protein
MRKRCSKLDPKSPFAYNSLGWAYQHHYKYDEAIEQFKKQIEVTPEAFNPHANLGVLLCSRKRCSEAMPELEKALELSPEQPRALLAEGKCDIDLGSTAKGVSEMEQAASQSASSSSWNEAAYRLAEQNVELDTAKKWAETAITIESALLRDLSLDHVTPTQMRLVGTMGNYWETLGWVYFRMGKAIGLSAASIRHGECIQLPPRENTLDRYTRSLGGERTQSTPMRWRSLLPTCRSGEHRVPKTWRKRGEDLHKSRGRERMLLP